MKKILFILLVMIVNSCTEWEVLAPTDGELTVVLLNVYVTFDYEKSQLIILNENSGGALVRVSRRVDDCWADYTEILNRHVSGGTEITKKAYFDTDDKIELYVKIDNRYENDPERYTHFQLGKQALAAQIFPDQPLKDFEIEVNRDEGLIIIEFTLD